MALTYPDWESLKHTREKAIEHRNTTGHKIRTFDLGSSCCECPWHYIALIITDPFYKQPDEE